ncbi:response regulator [Actinobacillus pleuropneumoniae]|uniref:Transcriptional regulatory protein QseB n=6 Tax=Actinobacillus pleuropneumoniae TaxID=715 RepID=A3N169_ACTP2|nr:response regulator [Actinobacillus pleuropneumoniae]ABN74155.1 transcriptional regulatory protein QseB [Actinobacillus pleuropneumoniae serovar 5b str. L20]ACE61773.1 transcriptional regulatory protein QseB [Actinobacillus pleuropneumoniae serovar 7 str. AP76]ASU14883.1 Transcriptional regulatory protein QseB [Actinobacillus pleuropneumoniae]AWG95491.1 two-component system response regulator QseB [Actinobacillus pleuropneumoniae serovar 1 str. 4074]AXA21562.1 two-component system response r
MRILLIEDDKLIGDGLKLGLTKQNFVVDWFQDGKLGFEALFSTEYDAVVLDLTLPKMDGLAILKNWRKENLDIPVLILTARDTLDERILGFNSGADDYLCKPFALMEVVVRLQALIRRRYKQSSTEITLGDLTIDSSTHKVTLADKEINLTSKEFQLLLLFASNKDRVLTRSAIEEKLYSWDNDVSSNAMEVYIHNLRKKLGKEWIKTVHGIGYKIGNSDA